MLRADIDVIQTFAAGKNTAANGAYAIWDGDADQAGAARKCGAADGGEAIGDGDADQAWTTVKCMIWNFLSPAKFNRASAADRPCAGQFGTVIECIATVAEGRDASGNSDAGQAGATLKCPPADGGDALGDGDAGQAGAARKCAVVDGAYAIWDGDAGQAGATRKCPPTD